MCIFVYQIRIKYMNVFLCVLCLFLSLITILSQSKNNRGIILVV